MRLLALLLLSCPLAVQAEDAHLTGLRALLVPMRATQMDDLAARGGKYELTLAKHRLRDWVGSRLSTFPGYEDPGALERKLNDELRQAKLLCRFSSGPNDSPCPEGSALGFIGDVRLEIQRGSFLILRT